MAEPSGLSWLAVARQILDLLDPLLELLCRAGVLESPGEVHDMLLVRSHEHQCLLERHILEGRHREAHHVHRLGHLGLLAHGVHPGRLDELFLELLQRASSVLCGFHLVLLITLADFTRARTRRNPRSQARGCIPGSPRLLPHARLWLEYRGLATVAARQRVGDAAQQPLVPALLPVPLLLGLLGLFLRPPSLLLLVRLLLGFGLPLLGPALGLLFFVAGYGACGFFRLALRLIHRSSFERSESALLLVGGARHVPDGYASFGPGPLHLGEVHAQFIRLLPGGVRDVQVLPRCVLGLIGGLTRRVLGLLGGALGGVLGLLGRALGGVLRSLRGLPCLVGNLSRSVLRLSGGLSGGVLDALHGLSRLVRHLADRLTGGILCLPGGLSGGVLDLLGGLAGLFLCLSSYVLGLLGDIPGGGPLLRLLGRIVHRVVEPLVAGRLVEVALDLRIGVDHLLQLSLRLRRGLLHQALELSAVVLDLTLEAAERVGVEVLGTLHYLLLYPLLETLYFAHSLSFLLFLLCAWALAVLLRLLRALGTRYGEETAGARPSLRLESCGWPDQSPRLLTKLRISGILHVADGDLSPDPGALHLGEVHAQLLGLALGRLRGVGLVLPGRILGLLGRLTRRVLGLIGDLTRRALGLLGGASCGVLGLLGRASCGVLGLLGRALGGVLRSLRGLPCLVGNLSRSVLRLPGGLSGGVLDALHGLSRLVRHLADRLTGGILCLPGGLSGGVLDLLGGVAGLFLCLSSYVLGLLGDIPGGGPLLRLLGRIVHRVVEPLVAGRLVEVALDLRI